MNEQPTGNRSAFCENTAFVLHDFEPMRLVKTPAFW